MSAPLTLIVGTKALSSWSLRPWLALKHTGLPFDEVVIALDRPDTATRIRAENPSGKVPALRHGDRLVWESLAILEYLAELAPEAGLWPADAHARAHARAASAEMHAGFATLRGTMPMNLTLTAPAPDLAKPEQRARLEAEVARVTALWAEARARFGGDGPFLYGRFSNADAMFAPVCTRLRTYGVPLLEPDRRYVDTVLALPAMRQWYDEAAAG